MNIHALIHKYYIEVCILLLTLGAALSPSLSNAEPTGGVVKSGSGSINSTGDTGAKVTTVNQTSYLPLVIHWDSFNVGRNETVNFVQPSDASLVFNRILDSQASHILGKMNANGNIWLINPNGIFFGKDAQVNVGGLVASALDTANPLGFPIFNYRFTGNSTATVENQGLISASFENPSEAGGQMGSYVALLGHHVKNTGSITTTERGTVALAAGSNIQLNLSGNKLISLSVDQNQLNAMAVNGGLMQADGGHLVLTAGAANSALASVVNNTGVMQAKTTTISKGRIVLSAAAKDGQLNISGSLNASGGNLGEGGTVHTQASVIKVSDNTVVDTSSTSESWGTWSLVQKNAEQSTADAKLSSMISGSALGEALNRSHVSLFTDKDLQIDTPVAWNAPSKLSLVTQRNIAIDAAVTSSHAAGSVALAYGQASTDGVVDGVKSSYAVKAPVSLMEGNNFSTQLGSKTSAVKNFYVITRLGQEGSNTAKDLQGMKGNLSGNYALGADIEDAAQTAEWNSGLGFKPIGIGSLGNTFSGIFDGLGHTITGLTIKRANSDNIGLFGSISNATVKNIRLQNINIDGRYNVGGLVGAARLSTIDNTHTAGKVSGDSNVGGLGGTLINTTVIDSDSSADVYGRGNIGAIGGLVGNLYMGFITNSHATGKVQGLTSVGGLIGNANGSVVKDSYSLSEVIGINNSSGIGAKSGGLIGMMSGSTVATSFAKTNVHGDNDIAGGLVGLSTSNSNILNSYAEGSVVSNNFSGGLVGSQNSTSSISHSFASVTVDGPNVGGVAAMSITGSSVQNVRWDVSKTNIGIKFSDRSSQRNTANVVGLSADQMRVSSNFNGFDLDNTWKIYEKNTAPLLRSFLTPLTVKILATQGQTYNADIAYNGNASIEGQEHVLSKIHGTPNYVLTHKNAGMQAVIDNGLYSDQLGYLIKYDTSGSQVQIDKAPISVNGITADSKVYDGNQVASMNLSNMQASGIFAADQGTVALNISGSFDTKDVGDNKQVAITGTTGGANGGNYFIEGQSTTTSNITPATYTALNSSKTYDGGTALSNVQVTGVNGEIFGATGRANSKNTSRSLVNPGSVLVEINLLQSQSFDVNNYLSVDFNRLQENSVTIIPGVLTYVADKVTRQVNQPVTSLTGQVTGFVQDDTLENSTQGEIGWTTEATTETPEGNHAVMGQGLTSDNYDFVQSEDNKTALTLKNAEPPRRPFGRRPIFPPAEAITEDAVVSETKATQEIYTEIVDTFTASDAQRVNTELRMGDRKDGYWFFDCILNSGGQVKTLKCKPASQKKLPTTAFLK